MPVFYGAATIRFGGRVFEPLDPQPIAPTPVVRPVERGPVATVVVRLKGKARTRRAWWRLYRSLRLPRHLRTAEDLRLRELIRAETSTDWRRAMRWRRRALAT